MDKNKAIKLLKQALSEIPHLRELPYDNQEFVLWRDRVPNILEAAFGKSSWEHEWFATAVTVWRWDQEGYNSDLDSYETALKSIIQKYEILGIETEPEAKVEPPDGIRDREKSGKELELTLEGTPDMILECVRSTIEKLNSQGYTYDFRRTSGRPDYTTWDKTYFAHCTIVENQEGIETQIGTIKLRLLPNERTLFIIPDTEDLDSPFGKFIGHLLGEFKRLGFVYFEEEKPPMGFRPHHEEKT